MLNSMYSKFDRLTSVHDVYKVSICVLCSMRPCSQQAGPWLQAFLFSGLVFDVKEEELKGNWKYFINVSFLGIPHNTQF